MLLACAMGSVVVVSVVSLLSSYEGVESGVNLDALEQGETIHVLGAPALWSSFPMVNTTTLFQLLYHAPALGFVGAVAFVVVACRHMRRRSSWLTSALIMLALIPLSYAVTRVMLHANTDPSRAGTWVAFSYLSTFYALFACCIFSAIDLAQSTFVDDTSVDVL